MKKFIISTLLFTCLFSHSIFAYTGEVEEGKPETYSQTKFSYSNEPLKQGSDETIGSASCGYFALTSAIIKETRDYNWTPYQTIQKARSLGAFDNNWGHFNFNRVSEVCGDLSICTDDLKGVSSLSGYKRYIQGSYEDQLSVFKDLVNQGYYVIPCMYNGNGGSHYIFLDYVENDDIRITDSGYKGSWISEYYGSKNLRCQYVIVLKGKSTLQPRLINNYNEIKNSLKVGISLK